MGGSVKIAIVDDVSEDRYFMKRRINKVSPEHEVQEFRYAEDALKHLRSPERDHLDVIILDINMPRMNGFEFADAFSQLYDELRGNTRVYMLSASINPADRARAEAHPAIAGFLQKPLTAADLQNILAAEHG